MAKAHDPIVITVQTPLSGRRTLAISESGSVFHQLDGALCNNDDATNFYRAVASYMGILSACGKRFLYTDAAD